MRSPARAVASALVLVIAAASVAFAHGGAYRGPALPDDPWGGYLPAPTPEEIAEYRAAAVEIRQGWRGWWAHEADRFFRDRRAVRNTSPAAEIDAAVVAKVVPFLRATAANREESPCVTSAAIVALARAGDVASIPFFRTLVTSEFRDGNPWGRDGIEAAVLALGLIDTDDAAVHDLLCSIARAEARSGRGDAQAFAAVALGLRADRRGGDDATVAVLVDVLSRPTRRDDVHAAAAFALGLVGARAAPELAAIVATGRTGSKDAVELSDACRSWAACALGRIGSQGLPGAGNEVAVVDALLGALSGGWAKDRQAARRGAIVALGVLAPRCGAATRERIATAVLATAGGTTDAAGVSASGSNAPERNAARVTLGRIAAVRDVDPALRARIVAHLRTALGERAEFASCHAALALGLVGRSADDAAAAAGGPRPDAEMLAALRQAFKDDLDPYRRGAYAIASGLARDPDAAPALLAALRAATTPPTVRGSCAQALALLGRADGVATCRELLDDTASQRQRDAGWAAATSLTLVGGPVTAPTLLDVLRSRNECPWTLAAAADGLGLLRDTACVDALLAIASDADRVPPLGRALAVAALGRIAERADISPRALLAAGLDTAGRPDFGAVGYLLEIL